MLRASRLLLAFVRSTGAVEEEEVTVAAATGAYPATLFRPPAARPTPGWVLLPGLTILGRRHPSLTRFARALAGSGATVVVPEIASWSRLRIDTADVVDVVAAAAAFLDGLPAVRRDGVSLAGFSFAATQALVAAADPRVRPLVRTIVAWGGYCELESFAAFALTGEHEWEGVRYWRDPDPYARWIVAGNYLTRVPGLEDLGAVAARALELAEESGRCGLGEPDDVLEPVKRRLGEGLNPAERRVWELLAPPAGRTPADLGAARELAYALAAAALKVESRLDPLPALSALDARIVLAHGTSDRLIPFTETLRLQRAMPAHLDVTTRITRLFAHSIGAAGLHPLAFAAEAWRLLRLLDRALRT